MLQLHCHQCGEQLEAPESLIGQRLPCPKCGTTTEVRIAPQRSHAIAPAGSDKPTQPALHLIGRRPLSSLQGAIIIALLLLSLVLPLVKWLRPQNKWEYRVESDSPDLFEAYLSALGEKGWELVHVRPVVRPGPPPEQRYEVILRRPKW
jgi:predicted RNA-binding Zn-ribbon protein involved in translation (DUF1610 family)